MDESSQLVVNTGPIAAIEKSVDSQVKRLNPTNILLFFLLCLLLIGSIGYMVSISILKTNTITSDVVPLTPRDTGTEAIIISGAIVSGDTQIYDTGTLMAESENGDYVTRLHGSNMTPYFDTRFFVGLPGVDNIVLFGQNEHALCKGDGLCIGPIPCEDSEIPPCTKNVPIIDNIYVTNYTASGSPISVTWTGSTEGPEVAYNIDLSWTPNQYDEANNLGYDMIITYIDGKIQKLHVNNKVAHFEKMIDVNLSDFSKTAWEEVGIPLGRYTFSDAEGRWLIALYAKDYTQPISGQFYIIEEREGNKYKGFRMFHNDLINIDMMKTEILDEPNKSFE